MSHLTIRPVGVSYMIELAAAGRLDVESLWRCAERAYGLAAGAMRAYPPPRDRELTSILIDRKGDSWYGLRDRLGLWVQALGARAVRWEHGTDPSVLVVHFEL